MLDPAKLATNCVRARGSSIRLIEPVACAVALGVVIVSVADAPPARDGVSTTGGSRLWRAETASIPPQMGPGGVWATIAHATLWRLTRC